MIAAANKVESEFTKVTNAVPTPRSFCGSTDCATGVTDTERKLSAIPVIPMQIRYTINGVDAVVKPSGINGSAASPVAIAIAFQLFAAFFPIHTPAIVGSTIVRIVLGS